MPSACPFSAQTPTSPLHSIPVGAQQERQGDIDVERFCGFLNDQELDDKRSVWCEVWDAITCRTPWDVGFIINIKTSFKGLR